LYKSLAFFLSSTRRHTRFSRDWSSDVCSCDLKRRMIRPWKRSQDVCLKTIILACPTSQLEISLSHSQDTKTFKTTIVTWTLLMRSEERRVGNGGGSRRYENGRDVLPDELTFDC